MADYPDYVKKFVERHGHRKNRDLNESAVSSEENVQTICIVCDETDSSTYEKPITLDLRRCTIKIRFQYWAAMLFMMMLSFFENGILFGLFAMFSQKNNSIAANVTHIPLQLPNMSADVSTGANEDYALKFALQGNLLGLPYDNSSDEKLEQMTILVDDKFNKSSYTLSQFETNNNTYSDNTANCTIRDIMFNSKIGNIKQLEETAIYFFSNQLLKGLLVPIVLTELTAFGSSTPFYKGTFFLFFAMILYIYAHYCNYATWISVLCSLFYSAGSAFTCVGAFSLLAQIFPEEHRRVKVVSLILSFHGFGVLHGLIYSNEPRDHLWDSLIWIWVTVGVIIMLCCLGIHFYAAAKIKKYRIKFMLVEANPSRLLRITYNKAHMYMFLAAQVALFNMKNLESTLNIWAVPHLKYSLQQSRFTCIPNTVGYMFGTLAFGPIAYKLRHMHIFFVTMIFNGLVAAMLPFSASIAEFFQLQIALGFGTGIMDVVMTFYLATLAISYFNNRYQNHQMFGYFYGISEMTGICGSLLGIMGVEIYTLYFSLGSVIFVLGILTCLFGIIGIYVSKCLFASGAFI